MSEFIKIKPISNILTGKMFYINCDNPGGTSIVECVSEDSLFTTELKEGDIVCFYNYRYDINPIKKEYTVSSIVNATKFRAVESTYNKDQTVNMRGNFYHYASKKLNNKYHSYDDKRVLKSSIVGYKKDSNIPGLVLLDTDESLIDSKEYDLVSTNTPILYGGTSANKKDIKIKGHYNGDKASDYKVQIDGVGVAQIITVTCVADSSGSLDGKGFYFHTPFKKYAVQILVNTADGKSVDSNHRLRGRIYEKTVDAVFVVTIDAGTSNADVASAIYRKLDDTTKNIDGTTRTNTFDFTVASLSTATFQIRCSMTGTATAPSNVSPEMTARSSGISFKNVNGVSSLTDTNYETDGLDSTTWKEWDCLYIENSQKNDTAFFVHSVSNGTITAKPNTDFVAEDAGNDIIIRNIDFSGSAGFSFTVNAVGSNATFKWSDTGGDIWNASTVAIKNSNYLNNGVSIQLYNQGYTSNDYWTFSYPKPTMILAENSIEELDNIYKCNKVC